MNQSLHSNITTGNICLPLYIYIYIYIYIYSKQNIDYCNFVIVIHEDIQLSTDAVSAMCIAYVGLYESILIVHRQCLRRLHSVNNVRQFQQSEKVSKTALYLFILLVRIIMERLR